MEIKVDLPGVSVNQRLVINEENFKIFAEAVKQYIIANREPLRPPVIGAKK